MTSPARSPIRRRFGRAVLGAVLLASLVVVSAPFAVSGEDDFEFGKKLAEARYFDYARKVYDAILADANRSDEDKGEARYGLALLKKDEAMASSGRADSKYADIVRLYDEAAGDIKAFVEQNPKNANAPQARLDVGTIRLAFVQWARELLDDPDEIVERGINADRLSEDAQRSVDQAIEYFGGLRPKDTDRDPKPYQELASYYYVISQYYRALVEPPCSPAAIAALERAGNDLEEYIMYHDGQLLAVYAQDIYGLVWWERAKCAEDPEKKTDLFNRAFEWFETCIYTDDEGPDFLRVITSGYYHIAQAGLDAGRLPARNFARDALTHLTRMLDDHPTAWRTDNGLRALVEQSKLECKRGNASQAIEVAKDAAERAKSAGKDYLERLANRQLNIYVSGGCGGSVTGLVDPGVLRRVADDLYQAGKHLDAIKAYRTVIASTPNTRSAFMEHRWHAWERMASSYKQTGDLLGAVLAYEPIYQAWMEGAIPFEKGNSADPNMGRAGNNRRSAQTAMKTLGETTGSSIFSGQYKRMRDSFVKDFPDHESSGASVWNTALDKWRLSGEQEKKNDNRWRKTMGDAYAGFVQVSEDAKSPKQDLAWVYRIRALYEQKKFAEAAAEAKLAEAFWGTPEAKEQEEKFSTVRSRRVTAKSAAVYWRARSFSELDRHDDVLATLGTYHATFPSAEKVYQSLAHDLVVQASLAKTDIETADKHYRILLRSDPKYFNLARITFLLADHYNSQRGTIQGELRTVTTALNDSRTRLRKASREAFRLGALLADLKNQLNKAQQAIDMHAEDLEKNKIPNRINEGQLREAKETVRLLTKERMPQVELAQRTWVPKRDTAQAEVTTLLVQQAALNQKIYEPLTKAAGYYLEWDNALKALGSEARRDPDNVKVFADMFWNAGRLRSDVTENWQQARGLYEDYLGFPEVQKIKISDPDKREAVARLGDVYVNLAEHAESPVKRRELVTLAVDRMQNSLADRAADNELVVGMLADKILVLRWRHPNSGVRYRFPIPRPATVKALRDAVRDLGKDDGPALPAFENEQEERDYLAALRIFRRELGSKDDSELKGLAGTGNKSTFDPILYKELANSTAAFRLALAWAYAETGREEDVPKAVNLALSLVAPPLGLEEDTPDWWHAREIQLNVYLRAAERQLTAGVSNSDAAQWLERAGKVFAGVAANFPDLGEAAKLGSRSRWINILQRLNALRGKAGMTPVDVNVTESAPANAPSEDDAATEGNE